MKATIHSSRLIDWEVLENLAKLDDLQEWEILIKKNWKIIKQKINADYLEDWKKHTFMEAWIKEKIQKASNKNKSASTREKYHLIENSKDIF